MSFTPAKLSLVIPCCNEEQTLERWVERVLAIADDASKDDSVGVAQRLVQRHPEHPARRREAAGVGHRADTQLRSPTLFGVPGKQAGGLEVVAE